MSLKLGVEVFPIREDREEMLEKDYGSFLVRYIGPGLRALNACFSEVSRS